MTRNRICIFYCLLGVLVLGHGADLLLRREHWPFSSYPMFAGITPDRYSVYQIQCLTDVNGVQHEVPLDPNWVPTLPVEVLQTIMTKACNQAAADPRRLHQMVSDYLSMYNQRRKFGLHKGPLLTGLRLYQVELPMAEAIANPLEEPPVSTWVRHLVVEVDQAPANDR